MSKPRLVLDTNVVLDLFHFDDVVSRPLRHALERGALVSLITPATLEELRRVLAYPEFALNAQRQRAVLDQYAALSHSVDALAEGVNLPLCSDPDDQKFLELAAAHYATCLVSKDRALLKLRRRCAAHFVIVEPADALRWLRDTFA